MLITKLLRDKGGVAAIDKLIHGAHRIWQNLVFQCGTALAVNRKGDNIAIKLRRLIEEAAARSGNEEDELRQQLEQQGVPQPVEAVGPGAVAVQQGGPDDVGRRGGGERHPDREGTEHQRGGELGGDHPAARGLQHVGHEAGALAPLGGERHDGQDREQQRLRRHRHVDEVREREVGRARREQVDRHDGDGGQCDAAEQPGAGPGIHQLAQLDLDQPAHRHGGRVGAGGGRVVPGEC